MHDIIKIIVGIENATSFNNWTKPTVDDLEREYDIEYVRKGLDWLFGEPWDSVEDFVEHALESEIVSISPEEDAKIDNRSHTRSFEELYELIKTYHSYGKSRTEETLKAIYEGFRNGSAMTLPIVIRFDGNKR